MAEAAVETESRSSTEDQKKKNIVPCIIVQAGGYTRTFKCPSSENAYKDVTKKAAREGYQKLKNNGTSIDAVKTAVCVLEKSKLINAGAGSALNCFGQVECDAMIMNGQNMKTGAVTNVSRFLSPVSLAKKVMDKSHHCAIGGDDGALELARKTGFPISRPNDLIGNDYAERKARIDNVNYDDHGYLKHKGEGPVVRDIEPRQETMGNDHDTASAVAIDAEGNLACATSTGGIAGKRKGRISDAAVVGCGGYANEFGAATTTGHGEYIMRITLAREAVFHMEGDEQDALSAQASAEKALKRMIDRVGGHAGIIAIDRDGNVGKVCNTVLMVWASIKDDILEFGIKPDEVESERL